jgi:predicted AAA+ superfamily ATPase
MYYRRIAESITKQYLKIFPIVGVMGPRQSGKSTMLKKLLGEKYTYVTFDDFELKELFFNDPKKFITRYNNHIIFDEAQYIPELFPIIKQIVDADRLNYGRFVLTGSGQFLMGKHISESLAGRIGLVPLLPMQYSEIPDRKQKASIFSGGYPELVLRNWNGKQAWYNAYLETYIQKDLRLLTNISDLHAFTMFLRFLAANATQTLNLSGISREIGITVTTLSRWLSVLESSYIIFLLQPYYRNLGKRLIKSPKIYFVDSGLLSFLTGIHTRDQWESGIMYGAVFENYIVSELFKNIAHEGQTASLFFLRTNHGDEIDVIIDYGNSTDLIEIKASVTYRPVFHRTLEKLDLPDATKNIVFQGKTTQILENITAWNYSDFLSNRVTLRR